MYKIKNKNIIFITDYIEVAKDNFIQTMKLKIEKEGGNLIIKENNNDFDSYFAKNHSNISVIIFDTIDNFETVKRLKKYTNNFASIAFVRGDFVNSLTEELYSKFDSHITTATVGCWGVNGCKFSEIRVIQKISSALKIHYLKHQATLSIIQKFIKLIETKENHTLLNIIDSTGKVIAIDNNVRQIFGEIVDTNVQDLEHKYDGKIHNKEKHLKILSEGDKIEIKDVNGNFAEIELITQWVFENGTTYYVQIWELTEDIKKFNDCIAKLKKAKAKIKAIKI